MWDLGQEQELRKLSETAPLPYVRIKALALRNVGEGRSQREVAELFHVGLRSVNRWVRRFRAEGVSSLYVKPGRGRRQRAKAEEIEFFVKQSPRNFGIDRTRWTLESLRRVVPSLKGFSIAGVHFALKQAGWSYKRGQPTLHSPDPDYEEKRAASFKRFGNQEKVLVKS